VSGSQFQVALISCLSLGLGYSLSSSMAQGYPAGPTVSYGLNPVVSIGGTAYSGETKALLTAPIDHDLVVTDVVLSSSTSITCKRTHKSEFLSSGGAVLGQFETSSATSRQYSDWESSDGSSVQHRFGSGLRVPAGESLSFAVVQTGQNGPYCPSEAGYGVRYAVSGYYANP
jgi:hypothetical protein